MSLGSVAIKRYAKALFELAQEQGIAAEVEGELAAIAEAVENTPEIRSFLTAPGISADRKVEAIAAALGGQASQIVLNTMGLLIQRGRQTEIPGLLEAYRRIAGEALRRVDAIVTSAQPLGEEELKKLAARFGELTGKTVRVKNVVDPSLLGGLTVRVGDTLYDGSLRGKLDRLSKQLQTSV